MGKKPVAPELRTALHVLQGAIAKVLNENLPLIGASVVSATRGKLMLHTERTPSAEEITQINEAVRDW